MRRAAAVDESPFLSAMANSDSPPMIPNCEVSAVRYEDVDKFSMASRDCHDDRRCTCFGNASVDVDA